METIFDHGLTPEEQEAVTPLTKEEYLSVVDRDSANQDIAFLYHSRGNSRLMERYADRLPDVMRIDFYRTITHP